MVKETTGHEFLLTTIIYFEHFIILVQQSCGVLLFTLNIVVLVLYSCGSQVKDPPSSGHTFHARSCVRRDYPSWVMEILSYRTINKSGRMSRRLLSGKYLSITK